MVIFVSLSAYLAVIRDGLTVSNFWNKKRPVHLGKLVEPVGFNMVTKWDIYPTVAYYHVKCMLCQSFFLKLFSEYASDLVFLSGFDSLLYVAATAFVGISDDR